MTNQSSDSKLILTLLQSKYSSAPYSFLQTTNLRSEAKSYLSGNITEPKFQYTHYFTESYQKERLNKLIADIDLYNRDESSLAFLQKRKTETELILALIKGQSDTAEKKEIIAINKELYELPSKDLFSQCLAYLEQRSFVTGTTDIYKSMQTKIELEPSFRLPQSPLESVFMTAKNDFIELFPGFSKIVSKVDDSKLSRQFILELFSNALADIGATADGWKVREIEYGANVRVSAFKKQVIVGKYFKPRSSLRLKQVVAHEIYCHVHRLMQSSSLEKKLPAEEEGIAIMCEQIIAETFSYKRMLRYIAVSLGWGVDGLHDRSFNEVYDIMWRAFMIISGCGEHVARDRAFYETARAFRGSNTAGGTVITKDCIYFISNLRVWQLMSSNPDEYSIKKLLMV